MTDINWKRLLLFVAPLMAGIFLLLLLPLAAWNQGEGSADVVARTANSITIQNADGSFTAWSYSGPVNFWEDNDWHPIDNTLVPSDGGYRNAANAFDLLLGAHTAGPDPLLRLQGPDGSFSLQPLEVAPVAGIAFGATIRYPAAYPGIDLLVRAHDVGVVQSLTLTAPGLRTTFTFELVLASDCTLQQENGQVRFQCASSVPWGISPAALQDAAGEVGPAAVPTVVTLDENRYQLNYTLSADWLNDPARLYPVRVDEIIQQIISKDTYVESGYPTVPPDGGLDLALGYNLQYNKLITRLYLEAALPSLPPGSTINQADLCIYNYGNESGMTDMPTLLYNVTAPWNAPTLTWNNQPSWGAVYANFTVTLPRPEYKCWPVTQLVRDWYSGLPNYGVAIRAVTEDSSERTHYFYAYEHGSYRPYLQIDYTPPPTNTPLPTVPTQTPTPTPRPGDRTPPSGQLTAPPNGSHYGPGNVYIAANAWDNPGGSGVNRVEFYARYSGRWHNIKNDYAAPYSVNWHIPDGLPSQTIEIGLHVVDNAGNVAIDPGGKRTIYYSRADTINPDGRIVAPADGIYVYPGPLHLKADAWDNVGGSGVNRVEFWAKYNLLWHKVATEYTAPYETDWNIPSLWLAQDIEIGLHVVDNAGNTAIDPGGRRTIHYRPFSYDRTAPSGKLTSPKNFSIVGPGNLHLEADAWDNQGGSGVKRVEFWIKYSGSWHHVRDDYSAPYAYDWAIPSGLKSQTLIATIHVVDNAGNMAIDPGGYRYVYYKKTISWPAPYIHQLWSTDPDFNGHASCGPSSLGMALAWYRALTPRDPWGLVHKGIDFKSPYSWYVTHVFSSFTRTAPDASCNGAYAGLHGWCGIYTYCPPKQGYRSDFNRIGSAFKTLGVPVVMSGSYNYKCDLTEQKLKTLVNSGRPTVIGTYLCGSSGHIVLVRGYNSNTQKFIVSDPYGYCRSTKKHDYDIDNKAYAVEYSWSFINYWGTHGCYIEMSNPIPGGVGLLSNPLDLVPTTSPTQTLLTLAEPGESWPFYEQPVTFDPQNGLLQTTMPLTVPPGLYDVAIKPPSRLAAMQPAPVYTTTLALDFSGISYTFALGDVDGTTGDNIINVLDVSALFAHWGQSATTPELQRLDLDSDGIIADGDLALLSQNYGQEGQGGVGLPTGTPAGSGIALAVQPQTATVALGDVFAVDIYLDAPTSTYGMDVVLRYDPTFLAVQDDNPAQPGIQIRADSSVYSINQKNLVDPIQGLIYLSSYANPTSLPTGGGLLGTVTFRALAATRSTPLTFEFFPDFTNDSNVAMPGDTQDHLGAVEDGVVRIDGADILPPTGSLMLNQGQDYTNQTLVACTLAVQDAYSDLTNLRTSTDGLTWSDWTTFTNEFVGEIPAGDGRKVFYVEARDASSNTAAFTDAIILDTVPPTGTIQMLDVQDQRTIVYRVMPAEVQEVAQMIVSQDPTFAGAEWTDYLGESLGDFLENGGTVYARLLDKAGNVSNVFSATAFMADFQASTLCGTVPITVTFADNSLGNVASWFWDFGDGATSSQQNPTHTYSIVGVYTASLQISGFSGEIATHTATIYVTPDGACSTAALTVVNQGLTVTFDGDLDAFTLTNGASTTFYSLTVGTYNLFEDPAQFHNKWYLSGVECVDQGDNWVPIWVDYAGFQVAVPLHLAQHVTCTFSHEKELATTIYLPLITRGQ